MAKNDQPSFIETAKVAKPFVKWVGGKRAIAKAILEKFPSDVDAYIEPFVGGGGMLFEWLQHAPEIPVFASDKNFELVTTYQVIKTDPVSLVEKLKEYQESHCEEFFLDVRERGTTGDCTNIAARFIYLNRTCFNGLYRVNSKGKFNVSYGRYTSPKICDEQNIMAVHQSLKNVAIVHCDALDLELPSDRRSLIYFDPPYHQTFVSYTAESFGDNSQLALRDLAFNLANQHAVFVSNSQTDYIRTIYEGCVFHEILAPRSVSAKGSTRKPVTELLIEVLPGLTPDVRRTLEPLEAMPDADVAREGHPELNRDQFIRQYFWKPRKTWSDQDCDREFQQLLKTEFAVIRFEFEPLSMPEQLSIF